MLQNKVDTVKKETKDFIEVGKNAISLLRQQYMAQALERLVFCGPIFY